MIQRSWNVDCDASELRVLVLGEPPALANPLEPVADRPGTSRSLAVDSTCWAPAPNPCSPCSVWIDVGESPGRNFVHVSAQHQSSVPKNCVAGCASMKGSQGSSLTPLTVMTTLFLPVMKLMEYGSQMLLDLPYIPVEPSLGLCITDGCLANETIAFGPKRRGCPVCRPSRHPAVAGFDLNSRHSPVEPTKSKSHRRTVSSSEIVLEMTVSSRNACENEAVLSPSPKRPKSFGPRSSKGPELPARIASTSVVSSIPLLSSRMVT